MKITSPKSNPTDFHLWANVDQWFASLNLIHNFTLDPCFAGRANDRPKFFRPDDNGLNGSWDGERVFLAVPFLDDPLPWLEKAYAEANSNGAFVVCLIRTSPEADWWQVWGAKASALCFPRGRIKYESSDAAPAFPLAILTFRGEAERNDFPFHLTETSTARL